MNLNTAIESEILEVYNTYWESYIKGDINKLASLLDERYTQVGSAESEVFYNKKDAVQFVQSTIDQVAGKVDMRNRNIRVEPLDGLILVSEQADLYFEMDGTWAFYAKFRASSLMQQKEGVWKIIHQHSSMPDLRAEEGDNIAIEKITSENLELRDAIKRRTIELEQKNRELQIESSLERVRTVAMGMRKGDDLMDICEILFAELEKLGFNGIRNAMINIYDDAKESFLNYDYSPVPGKTVTPFAYNIHPVIQKQVSQLRSSRDAFSEIVISGNELAEFRVMRVNNGEADDPRFDNIAAITYYFYSIGTGAIGLSSFSTLTEENRKVLMRFRNVFDLAYRRYMDISQAVAQARETEIQLALERVRARTMAMQKSGELAELVATIFNELTRLDFSITSCFIWINNPLLSTEELWVASNEMNKPPEPYYLKPFYHPYFKSIIHAWKEKNQQWIYEMSGDEKENFQESLFKELGNLPQAFKNALQRPEKVVFSASFSRIGALEIIGTEPLSDEKFSILHRLGRVFDLTYTRFLDLKQAEAQAREAKIEAGLERARTQSMLMQNSNELNQTAQVFHEQLQLLGIHSAFSYLWLPNEERGDHLFWATWPETKNGIQIFQNKSLTYKLDKTERYTAECFDAWNSGIPVHEYHIPPAELENYFAAWGELMAGAEKLKPEFFPAGLDYAEAYMKYGCFGIMLMRRLTGDEQEVLRRFSIEFERAYTRFLGLQKSEAQAREAQVELGLERVRSKTMAMHKSEELQGVVDTFFERIKELDIEMDSTAITSFIEGSNDYHVWIGGSSFSKPNRIPFNDFTQVQKDYNMLERKDGLYTWTYSGENKKEYVKYLLGQTDFGKNAPEERRKLMLESESFSTSIACTKNTRVQLVRYSDKSFSRDENEILTRFARVFEQAYTRFLDLQKSEAQAKEAMIEASLERVRSKAMAMHSTRDLSDTIAVFYRQLESFNITPRRCGVGIVDKDTRVTELSAMNTSEAGDSIVVTGNLRMAGHPVLDGIFDHWMSQEEYHPVLRGNEIKEYYKVVRPQIAYPDYTNDAIQYGNFFSFTEGAVFAWTDKELSDEELKIFRRFTSVLSLTYRRYKDLREAEAQTRQAQIETALEKVRARALAMQKPSELVEVAKVLRREMGALGVEELETSSIYIHDKNFGKAECWYALKDFRDPEKALVSDHFYLDLADTWVGRQMLQFYQSGEDQISIPMQGDNRREWINYCVKQSPVFDGFYGEVIPDRTYHLYKFSNGAIGAASPGEISAESWSLLKRATAVFSLAYTRFLDLQNAEAQAAEAVRQASLDRVRAEIASMRTTSDLDKITPLIWNELTIMGVPFIRCGVFIMDQEKETIHCFLSTPGGKALAAFHLPFKTEGPIRQVLEHWYKKQVYTDHWDPAAFAAWTRSLQEQGALEDQDNYVHDLPVNNLNLHFLPFMQGMVYVGSTAPLQAEEISLVQSLADAFSTAYARYEDFNKLELAKQQVDHTLSELRQTQVQLIQSEKMASLGELTAGIAHEIQNPLNFVNNFSEVNAELIDELEQEISAGNFDEVKAIANDIRENERKINHHGKRADAIVKGMLQHSRNTVGEKMATDINALADEYLRLAYHGYRSKDKECNISLHTDFEKSLVKISVIPHDIGRVLLNLYNNAFYAVAQRKRQVGENYEPIVWVSTRMSGGNVLITVKDNGNGIPPKLVDKIFQPFFTTKPTGQGTGLGLSLSYDIVKAHGGEIRVETKEGEGTEFIIELPIT